LRSIAAFIFSIAAVSSLLAARHRRDLGPIDRQQLGPNSDCSRQNRIKATAYPTIASAWSLRKSAMVLNDGVRRLKQPHHLKRCAAFPPSSRRLARTRCKYHKYTASRDRQARKAVVPSPPQQPWKSQILKIGTLTNASITARIVVPTTYPEPRKSVDWNRDCPVTCAIITPNQNRFPLHQTTNFSHSLERGDDSVINPGCAVSG